MKILRDIKEIREVVDRHAKYQKVMLIFDDFVGNSEIFDLHNEIKDICVFNKLNINGDLKEINNGYKMLIFVCSADSYLKHDINTADFVNVFIPTDENFLAFYLKDFEIAAEENYMILSGNKVDISLYASVIFNQFFSYFCSVVGLREKEDFFNINMTEINQRAEIDLMEKLSGAKFVDIQCLKEGDIMYEDLVLLDYLLISALYVFINSVHQNSLSLVDVFKVAKEDYDLIDKYYSMATNEYLIDLINLNYYFLNKFCEKAKEELLFLLTTYCRFDKNKVDDTITRLALILKKSKSNLSYLFLYNIFPIKT